MLNRWFRKLFKSGVTVVTAIVLFVSSVCLPVVTHAPIAHGQSTSATAEQHLLQANQQYQSRDFTASRQSWNTALKLYKTQNDQLGQRLSLYGLGITQLALDNYQAAITTFDQLLPLTESAQQAPTRARVLSNIGIAHKQLGHYSQAVKFQKQAGRIFHRLVDRRSLGQVLLNLGNAYETLGDYEKAEIAYTQSLKIARRYQNQTTATLLLNNLGGLYATLGDDRKAIQFLRDSLNQPQPANAQKDQYLASQASTLLNLGSVYHFRQEITNAIDYYQRSLKLTQQLNDQQGQVDALSSLGLAYEEQKNYPKALKFHQQSIQLARDLKVPETLAKALNNQGHTLYAAGKLQPAIASLEQAIALLENLRPGLTDTYKVSLFDTQVYSYNLLQQILIANNQPEAALEVSEKGRARAFAEKLPPQPGQARQLQPINLAQIRQIAQSQKATIVEYSLVPDDEFKFRGKQRALAERLLIWVVQPNGKITLRQVDLKAQRKTQGTINQIVAAARCLNPAPACPSVEEIANTRGRIRISTVTPESITSPTSTTTTSQDASNPPQTADRSDSNSPQADATNALAYPGLPELHKLLIAPITDLLPTNPDDRVVIVPQESLFLIPFPALVDARGEYLVQQHTLISTPSIQVLGLTQGMADRPSAQQAQDAVIFGNPTPMPLQLEPLPAAETEANSIAQLLNTQPFIGETATRSNLLQRLQKAQVIHLATHGLLEEGQVSSLDAPGALVFAQTNPNENALLTATEIAQLKTAADLVILSACDTGRGMITGDGVLGLSRSWMAAGASSVVVSLWAVNDQSTSYLMQQFYQILLTQPDRAIALRQAMLKTREKYPSPYHWAAFNLMGNALGNPLKR